MHSSTQSGEKILIVCFPIPEPPCLSLWSLFTKLFVLDISHCPQCSQVSFGLLPWGLVRYHCYFFTAVSLGV